MNDKPSIADLCNIRDLNYVNFLASDRWPKSETQVGEKRLWLSYNKITWFKISSLFESSLY